MVYRFVFSLSGESLAQDFYSFLVELKKDNGIFKTSDNKTIQLPQEAIITAFNYQKILKAIEDGRVKESEITGFEVSDEDIELLELFEAVKNRESDLIGIFLLFFDWRPKTSTKQEKISKNIGYRTKAKAGKINEIPSNSLAITLSEFTSALSLYESGRAHMVNVPDHRMENLKFEDGKLFIEAQDDSGNIREFSPAELKDLWTWENIESIDLPLLKNLYSIILSEFEKSGYTQIPGIVKLYVPDLSEKLGLDRDVNETAKLALIKKVRSFHHVVGMIKERPGTGIVPSMYPVLNFDGYDQKTNTISFNAPYLNHVIETVYNESIRRNSKGIAKLKVNGQPLLQASHSYLIDSSIASARNKAAAEIVYNVIQVIERTGDGAKEDAEAEPNIKFSTLIERDPVFQQRLEQKQDKSNKNKLLKTTFKTAWEYLEKYAGEGLRKKYPGIQLPDPNDVAVIPTMSTIDTVIKFSHPKKAKKTSQPSQKKEKNNK